MRIAALPKLLNTIFPEENIYQRSFPWWQELIVFAIFTGLFSLVGTFLPANGFIGWDWIHFWSIKWVPGFYPPWTLPIIQLLTWPLLIGITLAAYTLAILRRARHPISAVAAFFCLPLLWTIFLGQLEGLVLFGLLWLPWLAPFALMKPQISLFAFGARRWYLVGMVVCLLLSIAIWGFWPGKMLAVNSYHTEGRFPQNIGLGLWGLPITLVTVWFSRGDMDMLIASGAFIAPYLIPYNLMPLAPAISRLKPWEALVAGVLSWLPLSSNWIGPLGWWSGWLFVGWLWFRLAVRRYPKFFQRGAKDTRQENVPAVLG